MPLSYFPETMPQASGDQVMAPTPARGKPGQVKARAKPGPPGGAGRGRDGAAPTDLVEELGQLHLHLLALEHVVLRLLADGRDQVELPGHRVGLLWVQRGLDGSCLPAGLGSPGEQAGGTKASLGKAWPACPSPLTAFLGAWERVWVVGREGDGIDRGAHSVVRLWVLALSGWEALGKRLTPPVPQFPHLS